MYPVIVGAGAVGVFLAQSLAQQGQVQVLVREPQLSHFRNFPKVVGASTFDNSKNIKVDALTTKQTLLPESIVFLCTKAHQLPQALQELAPRLTPEHTVIFCQNGLGIVDVASSSLPQLPKAHLVRMLCLFGVLMNEQRACVLSGTYAATVAGADPQRIAALQSRLQKSGFQVKIAESIATAEWEKTILNLVTNSLATLANEKNGIVVNDPYLRQLAIQVVQEALAVASKEGVQLSVTSESIFRSISAVSENSNSHLVDIRRGVPTDLAFIFEAFLKRAHTVNISTPTVQVLWQLLQSLEQRSLR